MIDLFQNTLFHRENVCHPSFASPPAACLPVGRVGGEGMGVVLVCESNLKPLRLEYEAPPLAKGRRDGNEF